MQDTDTAPTPRRKLVIFYGGSAANSLVDVFDEVINNNNYSLSYVIPISDNGGSSSELIRVFGGPGIGDVRSEWFQGFSVLRNFQQRLAVWICPFFCFVSWNFLVSTTTASFVHCSYSILGFTNRLLIK